VTEITLDHEFLMSSLHTDSERTLAVRAVERHGGQDLRVLVGGLGLGYTAAAALDTGRVCRVRVVELLPPVIRWVREGHVPLARRLAAEPRLEVEEGDVYALLAAPGAAEHDVILIDVDHSPDERLDHGPGRFYTAAGLAAARAHLAPGGVLGVWSSGPHPAFEAALREVFRDVLAETVSFRNRHLGERQTDWLYFAVF
jgi:spermidine synthase